MHYYYYRGNIYEDVLVITRTSWNEYCLVTGKNDDMPQQPSVPKG